MEKPVRQPFPRNINVRVWTKYLKKRLTNHELSILQNIRDEKIMNSKMKELHDKVREHNLYVSELTKLHGNCLFESLIYYGLADSVSSIREGLAYVMYQFQDYKNFFPSQEESLGELFQYTNEIEHVICSNNKKLYKYSFNVMCQDIVDDMSWAKLPTQLILMTLSLIYKIEIVIYNNENDWVNKVNVWENTDTEVKTIYIGHILESHYVPLDIDVDGTESAKYYKTARSMFFRWGNYVEERLYTKQLEKYEENLQRIKNEKSSKVSFIDIEPSDSDSSFVNFK
jgi:hypothetical protein